MVPRTNRTSPLVVLSFLAIYMIWGSTYLAMRVGVQDLPPFLFAGIRHLSAGVIVALICLIGRQPFPRSGREYFDLSVAGLLLLFCGNGLVAWAEQWVTSSLTSVILAIIPLVTAALGALLPGNRMRPRGWLGLAMGFAGVAVLIGPAVPAGGKWLLGLGAILLAAVFWSLGMVYIQQHPVRAPLFPGLAVQMAAGGLAATTLGLVMGQARIFKPTVHGLASLLYLIVFGSVLAYSAFGYLLRRIPAAKVATHAYVNPVVGVILGALILREDLSLRMLFAVPLVLGGVMLVQTARVTGEGQQGEKDRREEGGRGAEVPRARRRERQKGRRVEAEQRH